MRSSKANRLFEMTKFGASKRMPKMAKETKTIDNKKNIFQRLRNPFKWAVYPKQIVNISTTSIRGRFSNDTIAVKKPNKTKGVKIIIFLRFGLSFMPIKNAENDNNGIKKFKIILTSTNLIACLKFTYSRSVTIEFSENNNAISISRLRNEW